ncbi:hypothetical protein VWM68_10035, partial [Campylobacter coli]
SKIVKHFGGLHGFTKFDRSFLTDSGGFQAFSLSANSKHFQEGTIASVFFASLAAINEFGAVDLVFLMICLLLLVMGIINLGLLFKQI